jgi:hypothetical protein
LDDENEDYSCPQKSMGIKCEAETLNLSEMSKDSLELTSGKTLSHQKEIIATNSQLETPVMKKEEPFALVANKSEIVEQDKLNTEYDYDDDEDDDDDDEYFSSHKRLKIDEGEEAKQTLGSNAAINFIDQTSKVSIKGEVEKKISVEIEEKQQTILGCNTNHGITKELKSDTINNELRVDQSQAKKDLQISNLGKLLFLYFLIAYKFFN